MNFIGDSKAYSHFIIQYNAIRFKTLSIFNKYNLLDLHCLAYLAQTAQHWLLNNLLKNHIQTFQMQYDDNIIFLLIKNRETIFCRNSSKIFALLLDSPINQHAVALSYNISNHNVEKT